MSKVTSVRLSDELAAQLDRLAAAVDQPRAWLIEQAITRYLEQEAWQMQAIADALAEYRAGNTSGRAHDGVMDKLAATIRERLDNASHLA